MDEIRWPEQDQATAPDATPDPDAPHREWVTKQDPDKLLEAHEALRSRVEEEANKRAQRAIAKRDQELRDLQQRHQQAEQAGQRREQEWQEVLSVLGGEFEPTEKYGKEAALQKLRQLAAPDWGSIEQQYAAQAASKTRTDEWGRDLKQDEFDAIFYGSASFGEMSRKLAAANGWLSPDDHKKALESEVEAARADERTKIQGDRPNPESFRAANGGGNGHAKPSTEADIDTFKRRMQEGNVWDFIPAAAARR